MVKSNWTKEKLKRYIKEGRGQGVEKEYLPWTYTYNYASRGRATRIFGLKTGRTHHLHSDNQYRAFLLFEFNSKVIDIRESFPLLDIDETIDDKENLRIDKFTDKETGEPFVLTTNFLLTIRDVNGEGFLTALSVKNTTELKKKITFEKLEIERRYWEQKNVEWKIITEKQLPRQLAKNLEWVRETLLDGSGEDIDKEKLSIILLKFLLENDELSLKEVLGLFDQVEALPKGTGLFLFRYLIAKRELTIDLTKNIDFTIQVKELLIRSR